MQNTKRRYKFAKHIGTILPVVTRKAFGRKGFAEQQLLLHWREMVGEEHARYSLPAKLTRGRNNQGGTLRIQAESGIALLMQHDAPRIIERINKTSGYELVERLTFEQAPLPPPGARVPARTRRKPPRTRAITRPAPDIPEIAHAPLREALTRLAQNIMSR
ncbi:MAG: DUF721 domain-containing protein, partial [Hyphomicrobiales bacterium]|nr:DUF721 domain-containing protein [Hyphomicrobiales bacterium]MCY4049786.1 DUF721 domain-containing protein [Hyphomicrobiales bacterium]MCY4053131.1 DUF721 domain-containing protein [Hyphomicrobiales bacterium]